MRVPIKAEGARIVYDSPGSTVYDLREIGLGYEIVKKAISDNLYGTVFVSTDRGFHQWGDKTLVSEPVQTLEDLVKQNERLSWSGEKRIDRVSGGEEAPPDARRGGCLRELID